VVRNGFHFSRAVRYGVIKAGKLHRGNQEIAVRVRNLSSGGALLDSREALSAGEVVKLELAGCGLIEGEVRWSQQGRMGLRFHEPVDIARLAVARPSGPADRMLIPDYLTGGEFLKKKATRRRG
jgi:hypothetical protein